MKDFRHHELSECYKSTSSKKLEAMCWATTYRFILGSRISRSHRASITARIGQWSGTWRMLLPWERNKILHENKRSPTTKKCLTSSSWNSASARRSSTVKGLRAQMSTQQNNVQIEKLDYCCCPRSYTSAATTEIDHRSSEDIPDKLLASTWPRLHCSTFKLWRCSLKAQYNPRRRIALGDFSWLQLCQAARCKRGGRIKGASVCAAGALTMKETESDDVISLLKEGIMSRRSIQGQVPFAPERKCSTLWKM